MATYRISVVNEHFTSSDEHECSDMESARKQAIGAALAIAAEQVSEGKSFFGAEVTLDNEHEPRQRFVVSAGASPLKA